MSLFLFDRAGVSTHGFTIWRSVSNAVLMTLFAATLPAAALYNVQPIINSESNFWGLSSGGAAAGYTTSQVGFLYQNGGLTDLGSFQNRPARVTSVNDAGIAVGLGVNQSNDTEAIYFNQNTWTSLASALPGAPSMATDINSSGLIVGISGRLGFFGNAALVRAFSYDGTNVTLYSDFSQALAVNDAGEIAGSRYRPSLGRDVAVVRFADGTVREIFPTPIRSSAIAISENGTYVAGNVSEGGQRGFIYNTTTQSLTELISPQFSFSEALGVNSAGLVVGRINTNNGFLAIRYSGLDGVQILNTLIDPSLNIDLQKALAINDANQILANGVNTSTGQSSTFLLTPVSDVPEPATCSLVGLAGLGLVFAIGRRQ